MIYENYSDDVGEIEKGRFKLALLLLGSQG
jgi:hypothetical protein